MTLTRKVLLLNASYEALGIISIPRAVRLVWKGSAETVELDGAKAQRVEIDMAAGKLVLSGGASKLLQADFSYNVAELEPQVVHSRGTLIVRTPDVQTGVPSLWNLDDFRNEWDLHLNDSVPMKMHVVMGAGSANLKLGSLSLTRLDLDAGAGPVIVDAPNANLGWLLRRPLWNFGLRHSQHYECSVEKRRSAINLSSSCR